MGLLIRYGFQWTMQNEAQKIDVISKRIAQIFKTDNEGKQFQRCLLRRLKTCVWCDHRPFLLLCDEDRDLPKTGISYLTSLVTAFMIFAQKHINWRIPLQDDHRAEKRHKQVQKYLPENIESPSRLSVKDTKEEERRNQSYRYYGPPG